MSSLFIDTTGHFTIGLLSSDWKWREYSYSPELRSSASKIHSSLYHLLKNQGMSIKDVERVFFLNGPGSYTGVRVSEGMAQIFSWLSLQTYSFYHHDVPRFLGHKKGHFLTNAFKREVFSFAWDGEGDEQGLIEENELEDFLEKNGLRDYPHFFIKSNLLASSSITKDVFYTADLIKEHPKEVFKAILKIGLRQGPFYFRSLEKEFKPSY